MSVVGVGDRVVRAPLRRALDSAAGGRDHDTMTITTITVTPEDVARLARTLLRRPGGRSAVAVVGPYAHTDELPDELHEVMA